MSSEVLLGFEKNMSCRPLVPVLCFLPVGLDLELPRLSFRVDGVHAELLSDSRL